MSDRRAGWFVVIVSAALAIVVCAMAYGGVSRGILESSANAGEAAIALLLATAPGILMIVALDIVAFILGKDLRIRIVAAAVPVLTIIGVLFSGGIAAESTDPPASAYWAAAGYDLGEFDCAALNSDTPADMQAALDELDHPEPVEIYIAGEQTCAAMLPGTTAEQAIESYLPQLEDDGWTILSEDPDWLRASRSGYVLWITGCWPASRSAVAIFVDRYSYGLSCDDTEP